MMGRPDSFLQYLQVTSHTRPFLHACYTDGQHSRVEHHAYNNAERFMYGLTLGGEYVSSASSTPLSVQPLLLYYGLNHYLKACLLTVDPGYPATAKVLAMDFQRGKGRSSNTVFLKMTSESSRTACSLMPPLICSAFQWKKKRQQWMNCSGLCRLCGSFTC